MGCHPSQLPIDFHIFQGGRYTTEQNILGLTSRRASPRPAAKQMFTVMVDDALPPCGAQGHVRNFKRDPKVNIPSGNLT